MTCWIGVASAEHVRSGVAGGFAQLGHGKHDALEALRKGDWLAYYSPREGMGSGAPVQAFTALGQVTSEAPYQAAQAMNFNPFRVDVAYLAEARPAPIRPMLEELELTRGRDGNWGLLLRGPKRRVSMADMRRIAAAMGLSPDDLPLEA
ncbi:EVE domain-containing protein [Pseudoroseicyclus sp. H15]